MPVCPGCSKEVSAEWRFCRVCGQSLAATVGELVSSDIIARRISSNELPGLLSKTLTVEEGQAALLFVSGRHDTTLPPGRHALGNVLTGRGGAVSVVLFRTSDVAIDLSLPSLFTSDPLPLTVGLRLTAKIEQPLFLWTNLASGAETYTGYNVILIRI